MKKLKKEKKIQNKQLTSNNKRNIENSHSIKLREKLDVQSLFFWKLQKEKNMMESNSNVTD